MSNATKPVLGYWDLRGFGHPIRFLLEYLNVDYVEKIYKQENDKEYYDEKFKLGLDFPNLPYWIDDNVKLTENRAILKYVARTYDVNSNLSQHWSLEMLESVLHDVWCLLEAICYVPSDTAEENYKKILPQKLEQLNTFIGGSVFITGNKISYVDFLAYEVFYHLTVLNSETLKPYPSITNLMKNFEALPTIQAYMNSPKFISRPCFGKSQKKYNI